MTTTVPHGASTGPQTPEAAQLETVLFEIKKVIVGQDRVIERLVVCLLARGHCLLEGVPGLAKTLAVETLAAVTGGTFARLQFTPDLLPADIVGTRIYRASTEKFDVELGPVFANFVLADEINRAPAKVQSALLEVMAERQVSIGGETFPAPEPFLVLATQNPIESEGVYPLPEAQRDRFLMKVVVDYPTPPRRSRSSTAWASTRRRPTQVLSLDDLARAPAARPTASTSTAAVVDYAVHLVLATRDPPTLRPARPRRPHRLRRQPPGQPRPGRRRPGPRPAAGPQLRAAPGRLRRRPRRAAPPPGALLRGAGPRPHRRPHPGPRPRHRRRAPHRPVAGQPPGSVTR